MGVCGYPGKDTLSNRGIRSYGVSQEVRSLCSLLGHSGSRRQLQRTVNLEEEDQQDSVMASAHYGH